MSEHDNLARIINNALIVNDHEETPVEHESNKRADSGAQDGGVWDRRVCVGSPESLDLRKVESGKYPQQSD